jgi:hypothetical protein
MKDWMSDDRFFKPARVVRLLLERDEGGQTLLLRLALADQSQVEWRFSGVSQLRFRGESTDLLGPVLLQREDVRSRGWEGARFRIWDYEEEFVSFLCLNVDEVIPTRQG